MVVFKKEVKKVVEVIGKNQSPVKEVAFLWEDLKTVAEVLGLNNSFARSLKNPVLVTSEQLQGIHKKGINIHRWTDGRVGKRIKNVPGLIARIAEEQSFVWPEDW